MTPLTAALLAAAVLVLTLTVVALWATVRIHRLERRVRQQAERIARLRAEIELTRLEVAAARGPRIGLVAAARNHRTKPLPVFVRHPDTPTRSFAREG